MVTAPSRSLTNSPSRSADAPRRLFCSTSMYLQRDGKELLRHLRTMAPGEDIRVVVVTGSADPRERAETLALGADAFFTKPFHLTPFMQLGDIIKNMAFGHAAEV